MYADIVIEVSNNKLEETYTYFISNSLFDKITIGCIVLIPFSNRVIEGFVINIHNNKPIYKLKEIISIVENKLVLNEELISISKYISDTYYNRLIDSIQLMLPTGYKAKIKSSIKSKYTSFIVLNKDNDTVNEYINNSKAKVQNQILNDLLVNNKILKNKYNSVSVNSLIKKEYVKEIKELVNRTDTSNIVLNKKEITLNNDQLRVSNEVKNNLDIFNTYLLYGITGSGKTEVYIDIIKEVIKNKKQVIMMIPEISLTPQMINRFSYVFCDNIAIIHSGLSNGEKYDEYKKILDNKVDIVIGARSSVFAPLKNLGLIIIDEEHTASYRQDNYPTYNAIDIAKYRCKYNSCPLILGSATPTLESFARANKGVYKLLELKKRAGNSILPKVQIIDMIKEIKKGNNIISEDLDYKIKQRLNKNEQVVLLLNKRGYSSIITCSDCGHVYKCPNCDISLTFHKNNNMLKCHYCDYTTRLNNKCIKCNSTNLKDNGLGTEKLEEIIKNKYKNASVVRMDTDTTNYKGSHEKIINDFKDGKYNILLGTQMISKGLDFPRVSLVGIINVDTMLNMPDYKSSESTFNLMLQTGGRAGRSDIEGEVVIQTYNPNHYVFNYIRTHNYIDFYKKEMSIRHTLSYPPYYYIDVIKISSKEIDLIKSEAKKIFNYMSDKVSNNIILLGPNPAIMYKINNIYKYQILVKYKDNKELNSIYKYIVDHYKNDNKVNILIDISPNKIL